MTSISYDVYRKYIRLVPDGAGGGGDSDGTGGVRDGSSAYFFSAAGDRKQATETLNSLDENGLYYGYVTLDHLMPYEEYMTFMDEIINNDDLTVSDIWCAPITWREPATRETDDIERLRLSNLGFYIRFRFRRDVDWDRESIRIWYCGLRG